MLSGMANFTLSLIKFNPRCVCPSESKLFTQHVDQHIVSCIGIDGIPSMKYRYGEYDQFNSDAEKM